MRFLVLGAFVLLVYTPALGAQDTPRDKPPPTKPATAGEQYQVLLQEFERVEQEIGKAIREAKTDEERQKLMRDKAPSLQKFPARFLELAEKNPKDPVAIDAVAWVLVHAGGIDAIEKALDQLVQHHLTSPKLGLVCQQLSREPLKLGEKLLRGARDKNPSREVKGLACLSLAQALKDQSEQEPTPQSKKQIEEAEKLLDEVVTKYGDIKTEQGTLADLAKPELYEIRNLAIGKVAPEITGEDSDGKKFKLSDYRGKVVVLDFWARW